MLICLIWQSGLQLQLHQPNEIGSSLSQVRLQVKLITHISYSAPYQQ
jgi:hypothetical protein